MTGPSVDNVRAALKVAAEKSVRVREAAEQEAAAIRTERDAAQGVRGTTTPTAGT